MAPRPTFTGCLVFLFLCAAFSEAQEPKVEIILEGLNHPCGLAFHPESQELFVSDSGNGRILKLVDGATSEVVSDFPVKATSADFGFVAGPLGIAFLSDGRLLAGCPADNDLADEIRVYQPGSAPQPANSPLARYSIRKSGDAPDEGNFFGIAVHQQNAFVAGRGDSRFGWINRLTVDDEKPVFKRFIDSWQGTETRLPTALTISPDGFVVAGLRGEDGADSVLAFFEQSDATLKTRFLLNQNGIVALAYGPNVGRLYALFNAPDNPEANGLYKLVGRRRNTECELQFIHKIEFPLAMAFSRDGDLFVAAGQEEGKLLKVSGLDTPSPEAQDGNQR